jgi:hypothetical protein
MGDDIAGSFLKPTDFAFYEFDILARMTFERFNFPFKTNDHTGLFTEGLYNGIKDEMETDFRNEMLKYKSNMVANWVDQFQVRERQLRLVLNGVELVRSQALVRTPFCDNDLIEFTLTTPPGLRVHRHLFIKALCNMLPELAKIPWVNTALPLVPCWRDVFLRTDLQARWWLRNRGLKWVPIPRKRLFTNYDVWFRTAMKGWVEEILLNKRALERGYFKPHYIQNLVAEHMNGGDFSRKLGVLLSLELWHRQFID